MKNYISSVVTVILSMSLYLSSCDEDDKKTGSNTDSNCIKFSHATSSFESENDSVKVVSTTVQVDTAVITKIFLETDTLDFDSLIYRFSDTLYVVNDHEVTDTVIFDLASLTSRDLEALDGYSYGFPDSLFLLTDSTFTKTVESRDTITVDKTESISSYDISLCPDALDLNVSELTPLRARIKYIVGEWDMFKVEECGLNQTSKYLDFRIRFDLVSVTDDFINLAYRSSGAYPLFNPVGTISIATDSYQEDDVTGTKDVTQVIDFIDLKSNAALNPQQIVIELPDAVECGTTGGGRRDGLGTARAQGIKKKS
jgi:hypothetical protein